MGVADLGVYFLVLPRRCGGDFVTEHFAFRPIQFGDLAYSLVVVLAECGVLPMLHIVGVGRFVINRDLSIRPLALLSRFEGARFRVPALSVLTELVGGARRVRCWSGVCTFQGDVDLLDIARFRRGIPIEFRLLPSGPIV